MNTATIFLIFTNLLSIFKSIKTERSNSVRPFTCAGKVIGGYYADVESNCQMFHVCTLGGEGEIKDIVFRCLNGTVFKQETRVCERESEVDCSVSEEFYKLNNDLYGPGIIPDSANILKLTDAGLTSGHGETHLDSFDDLETSELLVDRNQVEDISGFCEGKVLDAIYPDVISDCYKFFVCVWEHSSRTIMRKEYKCPDQTQRFNPATGHCTTKDFECSYMSIPYKGRYSPLRGSRNKRSVPVEDQNRHGEDTGIVSDSSQLIDIHQTLQNRKSKSIGSQDKKCRKEVKSHTVFEICESNGQLIVSKIPAINNSTVTDQSPTVHITNTTETEFTMDNSTMDSNSTTSGEFPPMEDASNNNSTTTDPGNTESTTENGMIIENATVINNTDSTESTSQTTTTTISSTQSTPVQTSTTSSTTTTTTQPSTTKSTVETTTECDLHSIMNTSFTCKDKELNKLYPDIEADCRVFHYCSLGENKEFVFDFKFECTGDNRFDVVTKKCQDKSIVKCERSPCSDPVPTNSSTPSSPTTIPTTPTTPTTPVPTTIPTTPVPTTTIQESSVSSKSTTTEASSASTTQVVDTETTEITEDPTITILTTEIALPETTSETQETAETGNNTELSTEEAPTTETNTVPILNETELFTPETDFNETLENVETIKDLSVTESISMVKETNNDTDAEISPTILIEESDTTPSFEEPTKRPSLSRGNDDKT